MPVWIDLGTSILSFVLAALLGVFLVPFLHKLKFGQPIKVKDGPQWHAKKAGTPTMGGFMFIISSVVSVVAAYCVYRWKLAPDMTDIDNVRAFRRLLICIVFPLLFGLIGFIDDYLKVARKSNDGLSAKQKMIMQFVFAVGLLFAMYWAGDRSTVIDLEFVAFDAGVFYYIILIPVIIYLTNAVNLTDGVDGLCASVTMVAMLVYSIACVLDKESEMHLYSMAMAGGCIGFLVWNLHPAKCFMGDTGSMYLGGAVTVIGLLLHRHLLLILTAMVYILEALSVVIQVSYFKYTAKKHFKATGEPHKGKRIFKMTPIHHHFEMCNFSEYSIVLLFSAVGAAFGVLGIITMFI